TILGTSNTSANFGANTYNQSAFAPSTQGMPDFFGQAFNVGQMAQEQQQFTDSQRRYQLATALGLQEAEIQGLDTNIGGLI
ncbi:hypothetical protein HOD41_06010, partial [bacterium]|nr:hypothetical protein [bacterium]